jgi:hypothetical protein
MPRFGIPLLVSGGVSLLKRSKLDCTSHHSTAILLPDANELWRVRACVTTVTFELAIDGFER